MNNRDPLVIKANWDDQASVWVATSSDVPGLVTEAESMDLLVEKLRIIVPELLELNGNTHFDHTDVPISLLTQCDFNVSRSA